ncbi:hypothetical protein [Silvanigrella sp.]|jgi:hypothetical protein|uniref:hypothetical protein n=1 Tax=Silvanigrella sp. TaxID=2024976 RepID=UPI0037C9380C
MSLPTNNMIKNEDGFIPDNSGGKMSFNDFLVMSKKLKYRQYLPGYVYKGKYYYYFKIGLHPEKGMSEIGNGAVKFSSILSLFKDSMPNYVLK